jgi:predicted transcriptional regulator
MATTVTLDSELIDQIVSLTKERHKATAVRKALQEYIRMQKLRELSEMAGRVPLKFSNCEIEEMESC